MKLIKLAVMGVVLAVGGLTTSNSAMATGTTTEPVIIVIIDDEGYRTTIVCNPVCAVQDRYWQGKAK